MGRDKLLKLRKLIDRYVKARGAYSWRGSIPPCEIEDIEREVIISINKLNDELNRIERKLK